MLASARTAPPLRSPAGRQLQPILVQAVLIGVTASALWYFGANAARNLLDLGIARGFGFSQREAGFEIGDLGYASAVGWILAVVLILAAGLNRLLLRGSEA